MSYTKSGIRTAVITQLDASGSGRWDITAGGEVDRTIGMVFDREWRRILNVNRFYRMAERTVNTNAGTGRIALSSLNSGAANTLQRLYRVISVRRNNIVYDKVKQADFVLAEDIGSQHHVWYQEGTSIFILPKELDVEFKIWVNYLPQRPDRLANDADVIDFPEDYEDLLKYEAAGWLMSKGNAETREGLEQFQLAQLVRNDMLEDFARLSTDPDYMEYSDRAADWGAQ